MKQDPTFSKWFVPMHLTEKEKREMDKKIAGKLANKDVVRKVTVGIDHRKTESYRQKKAPENRDL